MCLHDKAFRKASYETWITFRRNFLKGAISMMMKNRVRIVQNFYKDKMGQFHNEYHFYTTYGAHYLGGVTFPADGQVTEDLLALDGITKEIAMRYGAIARKTK